MRQSMLVLLTTLIFLTGCQDFTFPTPTTTTPAAKAPSSRTTLVLSDDRAILVVQEYLLSKAVSAKAKGYLTELYASGATWTAKTELLKDGSRVFNVTLTTSKSDSQVKPYWRQALWTVFGDGKVLPSSQHDANAIHIEADLQGLGNG